MTKLFSGLRRRLLLLVLLATLPTFGLILYTDLEQRDLAAANAQAEALRLARLAAGEQERLIETAYQLLIVLAQVPMVQAGEPAACSKLLANLVQQFPAYGNLGAAGLDGDIYCSGLSFSGSVNIRDRRYFQRAIETNDFAVGDYQIGRITGKPGLNFGYPLHDETGQVQGVVFIALDLGWLDQLLAQAQLPPDSTLTVIDRQGTILVRQPEPEAWVGKSLPESPLLQTILAQGEGTMAESGLDGVQRLYAFVPLADAAPAEAGGYVSIGFPTEVVFVEANRMLVRNLALLGLVTGVAFIAAWLGGDLFLLRQVKALLKATERLAAGDLAVRSGISYGRGELGQLAQAFDRMAQALAQRQAELRRVNRALRMISECNQALVRAAAESEFLDRICQILVRANRYRLAWIGLAEQDGHKTVRPAAQAGFEAGYLETLDITWADTERGRGPTGTAIRTGRPAICKHIATEAVYAPWREEALRRGYASSIALPLIAGDLTIGALNLYAAEPDAFDAEEVKLLAELADDVAYGITNLRRRVEHHQAEVALRESEKEYRDLFNYSLSGIALHEIVTDDEGHPIDYVFLEVNQAFEKLTGLNAEDVVGRQVSEVLPGIKDDPSIEIYGQVALTGKPIWFEQFSTPLNKHFEIAAFSPCQGQFATVFSDITKRKQAEQKLVRRNRELELLNAIIAASASGMDPETILETACRHLALAFNLPQAVAVLLNEKKTEAQVVAEYRVEGRPEALNQTISVAGNPSFQYLLTRHASLAVEDVQTDPHLAPIRELLRQGSVAALLMLPLIIEREVVGALVLEAAEPRPFSPEEVSLAWSVADQVAGALARVRLDAERQLLTAAIEQTTEGVVILDPDRTIRYVNPAFERMTSYSRIEAIGHDLYFLNSGKHEPAFFEEIWTTITAGRVWQGRIINRKKDGTLYTDETILAPVRNEQGEIVNYVELKRDVTQVLELEEQYRQAQKMEAIGRLTGGIAHDFNNLLTAINGFAELLQARMPPDSPFRGMVDNIVGPGRRAAELVGQLLAFSRKQVIDLNVLDLNTVVGSVDKMLRRIIGEDVTLTTLLAPDLWPIKADPSQMEQVILNLAVNARDAMPHGGQLTIETANIVLDEAYVFQHFDGRPGEYVLLAVSDTGAGMSQEVQAHIFEPFFTTKEKGKGTGLGLATVFGIVKQSGGDIRVYSEPGQGTTFKIYLPRTDEAAAEPTLRESDLVPYGSETILLVEDDPNVHELVREVLQGLGYTLLEAADAQAALALAHRYTGPLHLLLTDVIMPGLNGKALADQMVQSYPDLKILFMSGYANNAIVHHGVLEPDLAFIQKPFSADALARKVREVLDTG